MEHLFVLKNFLQPELKETGLVFLVIFYDFKFLFTLKSGGDFSTDRLLPNKGFIYELTLALSVHFKIYSLVRI